MNRLVYSVLILLFGGFLLGSCSNPPSLEERKSNLESKVSKEDCIEFTNRELKSVLKNLRDVKYDDVFLEVQENFRDFLNKDNNLYMQIVLNGEAKGMLNGKDTTYFFFLHGRIPETISDKIDFDDEGFSLTLKKDRYYVYSNNQDVDSLNRELDKSRKESEELKKKDFVINGTKVQFKGKEGDVLNYSSKNELTPDEIAEAAYRYIEHDGAIMIKFYCGTHKYVDYVYKTDCIIFVDYQDKIYKNIGGQAVKL